MRFKVYFQMSINLQNAIIEEEKHLITLGHHSNDYHKRGLSSLKASLQATHDISVYSRTSLAALISFTINGVGPVVFSVSNSLWRLQRS